MMAEDRKSELESILKSAVLSNPRKGPLEPFRGA